jgi:hypothetical protein
MIVNIRPEYTKNNNQTFSMPFLSRDHAYCVSVPLPYRYLNLTQRFKEKDAVKSVPQLSKSKRPFIVL